MLSLCEPVNPGCILMISLLLRLISKCEDDIVALFNLFLFSACYLAMVLVRDSNIVVGVFYSSRHCKFLDMGVATFRNDFSHLTQTLSVKLSRFLSTTL